MNFVPETGIMQLENETVLMKLMSGMKFGKMLASSGIRRTGNGSRDTYRQMTRIIMSLFLGKGLKALWSPEAGVSRYFQGEGSKSGYYRLLTSPRFNWRKLMIIAGMWVHNRISMLSGLDDKVLVLDDTPIHKRSKKAELISRMYDHSVHCYYKGYEKLVLGWTDGFTFIPADFMVHVNKGLLTGTRKDLDKRTLGAGRRNETVMKKTDQSLLMIRNALKEGFQARYAVFDRWFSKPGFLLAVMNEGLDSVCNLPRNDRIWRIWYEGRKTGLKDLYMNLKSSAMFRSVQIGHVSQKISDVTVRHDNGLLLKLVFCVPENGKWCVFASTNPDQDAISILETYAKRWSIEPFFRFGKQNLSLGKEQSTNFDVRIAMTTIRMIAWILLSWIHRSRNDTRTAGELFHDIANEFSALNLDGTILEKIFGMIMDMLVGMPDKILDDIRMVMDMVLENFASRNRFIIHQLRLQGI